MENKQELFETPLIKAVKEKKMDDLKRHCTDPAIDIYAQSYTYGTALVASVFLGNEEAFNFLLENEKPFDANRHPGLLLTAIRKNDVNAIKVLLEKGAPIDEIGDTNYKKPPYWFEPEEETPFDNIGPPVFELPIIAALQEKKLASLRVLLDHKPNLNKKSSLGYSAHELIKDGNLDKEVLAILEEKGIVVGNNKAESTAAPFFRKRPHSSLTPNEKIIRQQTIAQLENFTSWIKNLDPTERDYVIKELNFLNEIKEPKCK